MASTFPWCKFSSAASSAGVFNGFHIASPKPACKYSEKPEPVEFGMLARYFSIHTGTLSIDQKI